LTGESGEPDLDAPVGSHEWWRQHPDLCWRGQITLPPLPPLVSWQRLSDMGWRLMRGGWWLPPEQPVRGGKR